MSLTMRLGRTLASPVAILLTLPLLVLVVGGFFVLQGERRIAMALTGMTHARLEDQNRATVERVRGILDQAADVLPALEHLGRDLIATGDEHALARHLKDHMQHLPGMSWLIVARPDGSFDGVAVDHGDSEIRYHQARDGARIQYDITEAGLEEYSTNPQADYDPRERPWYQAAEAAQGPVWIRPYLFASTKSPGISRTWAVRDEAGEIEMVVNAELDLHTLSTYLKASDRMAGARSVIVTDRDVLLADTGIGPQGFDNFKDLPRVEDMGDPLLQALMAAASEGADPEGDAASLSVSVGGADGEEVYLAGVDTIDLGAADWMVARLLPESVVLEPARRFIEVGRLVAGVALAVALGFAVLLSRALIESRRQVSIARSRVHLANQELQQMGSYRLVRLLGEGGMGEVWLGRHQFLARPAAIKFVTMSGEFEDDEAQERFGREAKAISQLRCRNTIEIYDFGVDARGRFFYAMELLDGIDLDKLVEEYGPVPPQRCVHILRQVCSSLAEAHDMGLVHRDIKPGNIFVCRQVDELDVVKVLDFGLAIHSEDTEEEGGSRLTRTGIINGTPEFMAPEQCRGQQVDGRTDLYAVGCLAWWLLAGSEIFSGENAMDIVLKQINEAPQPLSQVALQAIPRDLERVIMACLAKDPSRRPPDARTLSRLLGRIDLSSANRSWGWEGAAAWWEQVPSTHDFEDDDTRTVLVRRNATDV